MTLGRKQPRLVPTDQRRPDPPPPPPRKRRREDLVDRLVGAAVALERTATCDFDRQLARLLREAADALEHGSGYRVGVGGGPA